MHCIDKEKFLKVCRTLETALLRFTLTDKTLSSGQALQGSLRPGPS